MVEEYGRGHDENNDSIDRHRYSQSHGLAMPLYFLTLKMAVGMSVKPRSTI